MRYIGVLQAAAEDAEAEAVPVVADPVPVLEFVEVLAGPSAVELRPQQSAPKRQPQIWKTHYVCTGKGCGWSGSARTRHAERKPNCPFVPCPLRFRAGGKAARLVKEYLAQCTEAQREHGLPPDGERALRLNETQLVVTVPEGCTPGDSFDVRMEFGKTVTVVVPDELQPGQVLAVTAPPKRKARPSDIARQQQQQFTKSLTRNIWPTG